MKTSQRALSTAHVVNGISHQFHSRAGWEFLRSEQRWKMPPCLLMPTWLYWKVWKRQPHQHLLSSTSKAKLSKQVLNNEMKYLGKISLLYEEALVVWGSQKHDPIQPKPPYKKTRPSLIMMENTHLWDRYWTGCTCTGILLAISTIISTLA